MCFEFNVLFFGYIWINCLISMRHGLNSYDKKAGYLSFYCDLCILSLVYKFVLLCWSQACFRVSLVLNKHSHQVCNLYYHLSFSYNINHTLTESSCLQGVSFIVDSGYILEHVE